MKNVIDIYIEDEYQGVFLHFVYFFVGLFITLVRIQAMLIFLELIATELPVLILTEI